MIDRQRAASSQGWAARPPYDELLAVGRPAVGAGPSYAPEKLSKRHAGAMTALGRPARRLESAHRARLPVGRESGDDHKEALWRRTTCRASWSIAGEDHPQRARTGAATTRRRLGLTRPGVDEPGLGPLPMKERARRRHYPVHAMASANHLIGEGTDRPRLSTWPCANAFALTGKARGHAFGFVHRRIMRGRGDSRSYPGSVLNT